MLLSSDTFETHCINTRRPSRFTIGSMKMMELVYAHLVCRCFIGIAPTYLWELCCSVSALVGRRTLRSYPSDELLVPRVNTSTAHSGLQSQVLSLPFEMRFLWWYGYSQWATRHHCGIHWEQDSVVPGYSCFSPDSFLDGRLTLFEWWARWNSHIHVQTLDIF